MNAQFFTPVVSRVGFTDWWGSDKKAVHVDFNDRFFIGYSEYVGEGNGTPLQHSCLENPMDRGAWWAAVHGVAKSRTRLSDFTFSFHFHPLEKEMATHSSILAWRIPRTGKPGGLPSLGSHRVGHDWSDLAAAVAVAWLIHVEIWQKTKKFCKAIILNKKKLIH